MIERSLIERRPRNVPERSKNVAPIQSQHPVFGSGIDAATIRSGIGTVEQPRLARA